MGFFSEVRRVGGSKNIKGLEVLDYKLISFRDCAKCVDSFAVSPFTNISDGKVQITSLILSDEEPCLGGY